MTDVDEAAEGQGSTDNSFVTGLANLANLHCPEQADQSQSFEARAKALEVEIDDRLMGLEAELQEHAFGRIEALEAQVEGLKAELTEPMLSLEALLKEWLDKIKVLEVEIAFQRKVNSSWQTPLPPRPKQDP